MQNQLILTVSIDCAKTEINFFILSLISPSNESIKRLLKEKINFVVSWKLLFKNNLRIHQYFLIIEMCLVIS